MCVYKNEGRAIKSANEATLVNYNFSVSILAFGEICGQHVVCAYRLSITGNKNKGERTNCLKSTSGGVAGLPTA